MKTKENIKHLYMYKYIQSNFQVNYIAVGLKKIKKSMYFKPYK